MGLAERLDVTAVVVVAAVSDETLVVEATAPVARAVPMKLRRLKCMIRILESG